MRSDSRVVSKAFLLLGLAGGLAGGCGAGAKAVATDGGFGGSGGAPAPKFGAVIVEAPGLGTGTPAYFASAAFSDAPRLVPVGEFTSLDFGIGEPAGCSRNTSGGCQVFRCSKPIEATLHQDTDADVGAISIGWSPAADPSGGGSLRQITFSPDNYDLFYWGNQTLIARFTFSAAGGTIPAFPATEVEVPQLFEVTRLNDLPASATPPPSVSPAAGLRVTWTGGTGDAVLELQQRSIGGDGDLRAVCRVPTSAGSFTFSADLLGRFQAGDVSLVGSAVSSKLVMAGDHATTLAIAAPLLWHLPFVLE